MAILAGVGVGLYTGVREACDSMIHTGLEQKPVAENQPAYAACYEQYRQLYPALRDAFKRLAK